MPLLPIGLPSWERTVLAVELVRRRLLRATAALDPEGIASAVVGGNAIAAWVRRVDRAAVGFTQDVDLLIRREDFETVGATLESAGFRYRPVAGIDMFFDRPCAKARDSVHVVFAGERVRPDSALPATDVAESDASEAFRVLSLDALLRMKPTSFPDKDRMHLRDLIDVGRVDESWREELPGESGKRLQTLLETPEG